LSSHIEPHSPHPGSSRPHACIHPAPTFGPSQPARVQGPVLAGSVRLSASGLLHPGLPPRAESPPGGHKATCRQRTRADGPQPKIAAAGRAKDRVGTPGPAAHAEPYRHPSRPAGRSPAEPSDVFFTARSRSPAAASTRAAMLPPPPAPARLPPWAGWPACQNGWYAIFGFLHGLAGQHVPPTRAHSARHRGGGGGGGGGTPKPIRQREGPP
jgi:hypothetical protein